MIDEETRIAGRDELPVWFAMSATFGRELKAKSYLESHAVECFVPMKYGMVPDKQRGKIRRLIPAINNLLFARASRERLQTLKSGLPYLQYHTRPENGRNVPIVVPEAQMRQFITVCNMRDEKLVYLSPDEVNLEKGTPVRIVGSVFDGVEGTFVRVEKSRKKQVVVLVQGVAAVMIVELHDGYLQVLE